MNKQTASLMSEATLWQLYRRLLAARLLEQRADSRAPISSAAAAALCENLREGDTLGLASDDLVTRYLWGMSLECLSANSGPKRKAAQRTVGWAIASDAEHALLPGAGSQQAALALGTALASRLHRSGSVTVLMRSGPRRAATSNGAGAGLLPLAEWAEAAEMAVALQLPLLFVTDDLPGASSIENDPRRPAALLPAIPVDRVDALALYRVIYESVARAREGGGPTWVDCRSVASLKTKPDERRRATELALQKLEEGMRARHIFTREQQKSMERVLEREFARVR